MQLALSVKGSVLDTVLLGIADVKGTLARVSENNAAGVDSLLEHHLDLALACTVKTSPHGIKHLENTGLRVALDSVERRDARHGCLPGLQVSDKGQPHWRTAGLHRGAER